MTEQQRLRLRITGVWLRVLADDLDAIAAVEDEVEALTRLYEAQPLARKAARAIEDVAVAVDHALREGAR